MKRITRYRAWMLCITLVLLAGCDTNVVTEDAAPVLEDVDSKAATDAYSEALKHQLETFDSKGYSDAFGKALKHQASGGVYVVVDEMPTLVGGFAAVVEVLEYPASARDAGLEGRVYVSFTVDVEGKPTDITVMRSPDEALGQAAVDAVEQQRFTPGKQDGEPVPVKMSLPVSFRLQQ